MTDAPSVSLTPKPGSDLWIVNQMTCPSGHVVQDHGERSTEEVSLRIPEKSLVWCEGCGEYWSVVKKTTVVEPHQRLLKQARDEGIVESETQLAPDCQADGCEEPARYQYEVRKTCSAGPYSVSRERCEDHQLETSRRDSSHYTQLSKVFGKGKELEMDPHYFCKENGGEWCVDGYEESCPVHG